MAGQTSFRRAFTARGAPPGHLAAPAGAVEPRISVTTYGASTLEEVADCDQAAALAAEAPPGGVRWIDVRGLGDGSVARRLGERLGVHPLAIADVVNAGQRPKVDTYEDGTFAVARMVTLEQGAALRWEQVSIFVREGLVLTFQETHEDCLEPLRGRIRAGRPAMREGGAGYLAVMVIDAIVDGYFPVIALLGERLEGLEDALLDGGPSGRETLTELYATKRNFSHFRRAAWPLREALGGLLRGETGLAEGVNRLHLRDVHDHVAQVADVNDSYGELATSLIDVHLSLTGQRTNDVMRVLTVVSTIFIPLTFLAGIYGMNFDTSAPMNMPELRSPYGYPIFLGVSATLAGGLVALFGRLGWLGR